MFGLCKNVAGFVTILLLSLPITSIAQSKSTSTNKKVEIQIPSLNELAKAFNTNNYKELEPWICKDLELQDSFGYVRFKYPLKDELRQDKSGLFSTLTDLKNGIPALVNIPVTAIYARQIVSDGVVPLHVYFIENDAPISQLVLKYKDGKYRVYSVKLR